MTVTTAERPTVYYLKPLTAEIIRKHMDRLAELRDANISIMVRHLEHTPPLLNTSNQREAYELDCQLSVLKLIEDQLMAGRTQTEIRDWVFRQFVIKHDSLMSSHNDAQLAMLAKLAREFFV